MAKKNFPKTHYVKIEEDSDTSYFVADADPILLAEQGDKIRLAQYQLVEVSNIELVAKITK